MKIFLISFLVCACGFLMGCSLLRSSDDFVVGDAGMADAMADTGTDTMADTGTDAMTDAGADAGDASAPCGSGETLCGEACTDLTVDINNCGRCGEVCPTAVPNADAVGCSPGGCVITACAPNFLDLNSGISGGVADGCEVDTRSDPENCGGEGIDCGGVACLNSVCDPYLEVATGRHHACARRESGEVFCWGNNESRQLGGLGPTPQEAPMPLMWQPPGSSSETVAIASALAAGEATTCFVSNHDDASQGDVICLGSNSGQRLGRSGSNSAAPIEFMVALPTAPFAGIRSALFHSCGFTTDGDLFCWGVNGSGRTGRLTSDALAQPVDLPGTAPDNAVEELALGITYSCARVASGAVYCFGDNRQGELGQLSATPALSATPLAVLNADGSPLEDAVRLVGGSQGACVITNSNELKCWGDNTSANLQNAGVDVFGATRVASDVSTAFMNHLGLCWVATDGTATCRGRNIEGQFGTGGITGDGITIARVVPELDGMTSAEGGFEYGCGFRDSELLCFGYSDSGEVPRDSLLEEIPAALQTDVGTLDTVSLGATAAFAMSGGDGFSWGIAQARQLGVTSQLPRSSPTPVPGLTGVVDIAAAPSGGCAALASDVRCWGRVPFEDGTGAFILGITSMPTTIPGAPAASNVDFGGTHACAIASTSTANPGRVSCWGGNQATQTGQPTGNPVRPAEVLVGGTPLVATSLALGLNHSCALEPTGNVVCWGRGVEGQLGIGSSPASAVPTRLSLPNVTQLAAGVTHTCAISDGRLFCWGDNANNQLGNPTGAFALNPQLADAPPGAGAAGSATAVAVGNRSTCAAFADGQVRCTGNNDFFQLGRAGPNASRLGEPLEGLDDVVQLEAHDDAFCAQRSDGSWLCWGHNRYGRLSTDPALFATPTMVPR